MKGLPRDEAYAERVELVCVTCGAAFQRLSSKVYNPEASFCSMACTKGSAKPFGESVINGSKRCTACARILPIASFGRHKLGKDGLRNWCRDCSRSKANAHYGRRRDEGGCNSTAYVCKCCGREFFSTPNRVRDFCSNECRVKSYVTSVKSECPCGQPLMIEPGKIARGVGRFCSRRCRLKFCNPSSIECTAQRWLEEGSITFESQAKLGNWYADLYVPALNLVIEVNGCYYHSCGPCALTSPDPKRSGRDQRKLAWLQSHGYRVLVIWEHDFKTGEAERQIREAVGVV